jgi:hypothetical protein
MSGWVMSRSTIWNMMIEQASLRRLSPSTRIRSRFATPASRKMEMTATGSVEEIRAPKRRAKRSGIAKNQESMYPMIPAEMITPKMASERTGAIFLLRSRVLTAIADSKISGGRKR